MAAILLIRRAKGVHKVSFLLQYLQVEHDDGKDRKAERQQVSVQQQGTNIHEVKAEKRRVAAETVNTVLSLSGIPACQLSFMHRTDSRKIASPSTLLSLLYLGESKSPAQLSSLHIGHTALCRIADSAHRHKPPLGSWPDLPCSNFS